MIAKVKDPAPAPRARLPRSPRQSHQIPGNNARPSTPGTEPEVLTLFVEFDPTAGPLEQFVFSDGTDPISSLALTGPTTISFELTGLPGATWPASPINWFIGPPDPPNGTSITVDPPANYNTPWVFNLGVNFGEVSNIMSPAFYLIKSPALPNILPLTLSYDITDGTFSFGDSTPDSGGLFTVLSHQILINVLPITYQITLATVPAPAMTVTFDATNPILWSGLGAGEWPTWIDPIPPAQGLSDGNTVLTFSIPLPLNGQASGFQFVLDVGGVTVTSPDPILVNATIGDGG